MNVIVTGYYLGSRCKGHVHEQNLLYGWLALVQQGPLGKLYITIG
jgi:hypothetical protein